MEKDDIYDIILVKKIDQLEELDDKEKEELKSFYEENHDKIKRIQLNEEEIEKLKKIIEDNNFIELPEDLLDDVAGGFGTRDAANAAKKLLLITLMSGVISGVKINNVLAATELPETTISEEVNYNSNYISNIINISKVNHNDYVNLRSTLDNEEIKKFNESFGNLIENDNEVYNSFLNRYSNIYRCNYNKSIDENINRMKFTSGLSTSLRYRILFYFVIKTSDGKDVSNFLRNLANKIIEIEKVTTSDLPTFRYFNQILKYAGRNDLISFVNDLESEKIKLSGYDPYLIKSLLVACKSSCKENNITFPSKLQDKIEFLSEKEIFPLTTPKKLGGGKYNAVFYTKILQFHEEKIRIFKPVPLSSKESVQDIYSSSALTGISRYDSEAKYIERSCLTDMLDKLLYSNDNRVCVNTDVAITMPGIISDNTSDQSKKISKRMTSGILMDMAAGNPFVLDSIKFDFSKGCVKNELNTKSLSKIQKYNGNSLTLEKIYNAYKDNRLSDMFPQADISISKGTVEIIGDKVKFDNESSVAKCLENSIRLGILDYISGQTDRHYENYYTDSQGNILAIDNDLSFGSNSHARNQKNSFLFIPNNGSLLVDLPRIMTKSIKNDLNNFFNNNLNEFLRELKNVFPESSNEYKTTVDRLNEVRKLLQNVKTVDSAMDLLSEESLNYIDTETNYVARDIIVKKDKGFVNRFSKWNIYRANRNATSLKRTDITNSIKK